MLFNLFNMSIKDRHLRKRVSYKNIMFNANVKHLRDILVM